MGGSNETRLPGPDNLRMHESSGRVHIHDASKSFKFNMDIKKFKNAYAALKTDLMDQGNNILEGVVEDHNGIKLLAEIDQVGSKDVVHWSLDTSGLINGFDEIDSFLTNY